MLAKGPLVMPKRDAEYWAKVTSHLDFSNADLITPLPSYKFLIIDHENNNAPELTDFFILDWSLHVPLCPNGHGR